MKKEEIKQFKYKYEDKKEANIVFVLGTGRSGTTSIVDILNQNPKCKAYHEDIHQLIRISTDLAYFPSKKDLYYSELDDIFKNKIWPLSEDQIIIHSDQRLWNLVPYLETYFPNSKFIHLKRDIYSTVKSMLSRDWYIVNEYPEVNKHDWAKYRLQADRLGVMSSQKWSKLSQTSKCAWYWYYVNQKIQEELNALEDRRVLKVNLNDLDANLSLLAKFVSKDDFEYKITISNKIKKSNLSKYKSLSDNQLRAEIDNLIDEIR